MQMLNKDQRKLVVEAWNETALEIEEIFGIVAKAEPSKLVFTSEDTLMANLAPGALEADSLLYNSRIERYQELLPATTAKLCFQSALPADLLCEECIDDITFEYARRKIEDDALRTHWESVWSKHTPPRVVSSLIKYHPCVAYVWLYSVAGEAGLDNIVKELTHRARHQISLTFDEYMRYFTMRIRRFENSLDETELRIIRHLIENPKLHFNDLAKLVGISKEWTTRKLSQLQKRMILRRFDRVPFSRVGIRMFHILMTAKTSKTTSFALIKDCPFLFSFTKVVSGVWDSLATLCIPDNQLSMQYLDEGLNLIQKHDFDFHVHRITSSGVSHCFDYYSARNRQWSLPWELLTIHLQRIQSDNLAASIPRVDTIERKLETRLDELDIQILDCINKGITSVTKIRENLRVGQHRVANRLHTLRERELIVKTWEAHNIGLNEHVMVYAKDEQTARTIAAWSLRLPRSIISFSSDDELVLLADVPLGGSYGLASAIGELESKSSIGILSPSTYRGWRFPVSLWDPNYQKWLVPEKEIVNWIGMLS